MTNLLSLKYWFSIYPPNLSRAGVIIFAGIIVLFLILSLVNKVLILKRKEQLHRRFLRKLQSLFITNIIVLMFLFFLMYETIPFLSGRFWFLFWFLVNIVWLFFIFKFLKTIPKLIEEKKLNEEYKKYIP